MPIGSFLNAFPPAFFLVVHLAAFVIGAYFASRAFSTGARALGWGFTLFAIAEIVYMTYHLDWTVFLFAHTIAEVLDLGAFILVFVGAVQTVTARASARAVHA
jgi:predicted amidohydrolase